jgi:peptide/nickel transport system substrate-binding protein
MHKGARFAVMAAVLMLMSVAFAFGEGFVLNGVTLPFARSEAMVFDQGNFGIFDSFNLFIPNGNEFAAGHQQVAIEYFWYVNYATGEIIPWLADSYSYSPDYRTLTIKLNKKARWNDGVPFTAEDVVFTFNMRKADTAALGNPDSSKVIDSVKAPDANTVVYTFNSPQPRFYQKFMCKVCYASSSVSVVPKHVWEKADPKTFKNNPPVTTGPYMLMKTYPEQKLYVWVRNESYWNKARAFPGPKYLIYRTGPTTDAQFAEIKANKMDSFGIDYQLYQEKKAELPQINMVTYNDPNPRAIWFNKGKAPFNIPEFARALAMTMNRAKWATNIWVPPSKPSIGLWADYRSMDKYINTASMKKWKTFEYNPQEALKLLATIGYKKSGNVLRDAAGKPVTFTVSTPDSPGGSLYLIAQDWIEELKGIGIDATLAHYESSAFSNKTAVGDWDVGVWWWQATTIDPYELFSELTGDKAMPIGERASKGNTYRYNNKEFTETVLALAKITTDAPEAMALYQKAYDIWMQDPPGIPLLETLSSVAFNTAYWNNMPSAKNLYTIPFNWWGQILWVPFSAKPVK